MPFLTFPWLAAFACALLFLAMGAHDARDGSRPNRGPLWALLSLALSASLIGGFQTSFWPVITAQVVLYLGIGVYGAWRED